MGNIIVACFLLTHSVHPFHSILSRTTWVSRHQKGKPFWILLEQEMMGLQWHQLGHMQIICTSLQHIRQHLITQVRARLIDWARFNVPLHTL